MYQAELAARQAVTACKQLSVAMSCLPIHTYNGVGDWEKYRLAAMYSGSVVTKLSVSMAAKEAYFFTRVAVEMWVLVPTINAWLNVGCAGACGAICTTTSTIS